ncbi:MAG: hypothetical protein ACI4QI_04530 [Candidatus Coproplasma sp.]
MALTGLLYLVLTFVFCFITVHFIKLALLGFFSLKEKKQPPPKEKKSEPVYYIVEKKRQRKASYSPPKEIEFKK